MDAEKIGEVIVEEADKFRKIIEEDFSVLADKTEETNRVRSSLKDEYRDLELLQRDLDKRRRDLAIAFTELESSERKLADFGKQNTSKIARMERQVNAIQQRFVLISRDSTLLNTVRADLDSIDRVIESGINELTVDKCDKALAVIAEYQVKKDEILSNLDRIERNIHEGREIVASLGTYSSIKSDIEKTLVTLKNRFRNFADIEKVLMKIEAENERRETLTKNLELASSVATARLDSLRTLDNQAKRLFKGAKIYGFTSITISSIIVILSLFTII